MSEAMDDIDAGVHETEAVIDNGSFGTRTIRFETGRLAKQAAGSVVAYLTTTPCCCRPPRPASSPARASTSSR